MIFFLYNVFKPVSKLAGFLFGKLSFFELVQLKVLKDLLARIKSMN